MAPASRTNEQADARGNTHDNTCTLPAWTLGCRHHGRRRSGPASVHSPDAVAAGRAGAVRDLQPHLCADVERPRASGVGRAERLRLVSSDLQRQLQRHVLGGRYSALPDDEFRAAVGHHRVELFAHAQLDTERQHAAATGRPEGRAECHGCVHRRRPNDPAERGGPAIRRRPRSGSASRIAGAPGGTQHREPAPRPGPSRRWPDHHDRRAAGRGHEGPVRLGPAGRRASGPGQQAHPLPEHGDPRTGRSDGGHAVRLVSHHRATLVAG